MTQLDGSFGGELEFRVRKDVGVLADASTARAKAIRRKNCAPAIVTGFILLLACLMAWKMWYAYMVGP